MAQRSISTTFSLREGVTGRLADDSEQATGLRKDELEEEMKGNERFNRSMLWVDRIGKYRQTHARNPPQRYQLQLTMLTRYYHHYHNVGTYDDPTRIPSAMSSRIVGHDCTGLVRWCVVKAGPIPTVCPDCGHHFVLDPESAQRPL